MEGLKEKEKRVQQTMIKSTFITQTGTRFSLLATNVLTNCEGMNR